MTWPSLRFSPYTPPIVLHESWVSVFLKRLLNLHLEAFAPAGPATWNAILPPPFPIPQTMEILPLMGGSTLKV